MLWIDNIDFIFIWTYSKKHLSFLSLSYWNDIFRTHFTYSVTNFRA